MNMEIHSAVREFLTNSKDLLHRLRSKERRALSHIDLHLLRVEMHLLEIEAANAQIANRHDLINGSRV